MNANYGVSPSNAFCGPNSLVRSLIDSVFVSDHKSLLDSVVIPVLASDLSMEALATEVAEMLDAA